MVADTDRPVSAVHTRDIAGFLLQRTQHGALTPCCASKCCRPHGFVPSLERGGTGFAALLIARYRGSYPSACSLNLRMAITSMHNFAATVRLFLGTDARLGAH